MTKKRSKEERMEGRASEREREIDRERESQTTIKFVFYDQHEPVAPHCRNFSMYDCC